MAETSFHNLRMLPVKTAFFSFQTQPFITWESAGWKKETRLGCRSYICQHVIDSGPQTLLFVGLLAVIKSLK